MDNLDSCKKRAPKHKWFESNFELGIGTWKLCSATLETVACVYKLEVFREAKTSPKHDRFAVAWLPIPPVMFFSSTVGYIPIDLSRYISGIHFSPPPPRYSLKRGAERGGSKTKDRPARTPNVIFVVASHYQSLQVIVLLLQACLLEIYLAKT